MKPVKEKLVIHRDLKLLTPYQNGRNGISINMYEIIRYTLKPFQKLLLESVIILLEPVAPLKQEAIQTVENTLAYFSHKSEGNETTGR